MFLHHLVEMGSFTLNHRWHGINVLSILECALLAAILCSLLAVFFGWRRKDRRMAAIAVAGAISFATAAYAANTALSGLTASGALAGANLIYVVQTVGVGGVKATMTQVLTFIMSQISGDVTCTSGGACTVGKIGGVTPPSPIGSVTSVATACGVTGGTITATGTVQATFPSRTNTAATDTVVSGDCGGVIFENSASAIAVSQPAPTGSFASGFFTTICNINTGVATVTPGSGTILNGATYAIPAGTAAAPSCISYASNGTNFLPVTGGVLAGTIVPNVVGTVTIQSGTTYTFASTDCGTTVRFTNAGAVTATIPQGLPVGCNFSVEQAGAGQVAVNGSAVTPATLHSAHSYTKTSAQWAVIGIFTESSNVAILTGDGA